ncbi:MAG: hypothetical protein HZB14_10840 [Actinobacteria bacterium]|nr:hypothetical protein [Actinomycetota bacterium]
MGHTQSRRIFSVAIAVACSTALLVSASNAPAKTVVTKPKSSANPVVYGKSVQITGSLAGNPSGNLAITLQANSFPFAGYVDVASTTTSAAGAYSFTLTPLVGTRYRVATSDPPQEIGDELVQVVSPKVTLRVSDRTPKRRSQVRFYGTVTPAADGSYVSLQKRTSTGAFRTVARVKLVDGGDLFSRYSRKLRVSSNGVYRTIVPATPSLGEGTSATRSLRVH